MWPSKECHGNQTCVHPVQLILLSWVSEIASVVSWHS
jgi:hypothetical protein